jgi:hypothetical protein
VEKVAGTLAVAAARDLERCDLGDLNMTNLTLADPSPKKNRAIRLKTIVPEEYRFLFEPRPLLRGENPRHYDLVVAGTVGAIKPRDFVEWWLVKDLVDYAWDIRRLRLLKGRIVELKIHGAGTDLLKRVLSPEETVFPERTRGAKEMARDAMSGYLAGDDEEAIGEVKGGLACLGLDEGAFTSIAFLYALERLEDIDKLITAIESRRSNVLQEIDRRRFAQRHHPPKLDAVEDVEFETVGLMP